MVRTALQRFLQRLERQWKDNGLHLLTRFLWSRRIGVWGAFALDLLANICAVAISLLTAQVLAAFLGYQSVRGRLLFPASLSLLDLVGGMVLLLLGKFAIDVARWRQRGRLSEDFAHFLRQTAFAQHLQIAPAYHEGRDPGRHLLRFSGDLGSAQRLVSHGVLQYGADASMVILGLITIACLESAIALEVALVLGVGWAIGLWFSQRATQVEAQRRRRKGQLLAYVSRALHHLKSIQALNRQPRTQRGFDVRAQRVQEQGHQYQSRVAWVEAWPFFAVHIQLLAVLAFAWRNGLEGTTLLAIALILTGWRTPLTRLLKAGLIWKKGRLSLKKMASLLQKPLEKAGGEPLKNKKVSRLQLEEVRLCTGQRTLFEGLNLSLSVGQALCLYAPAGGGKTAFVKMLLGVYPPTEGSIWLDDISADRLSLRERRRQMAVISDAFPLSGKNLTDALSADSNQEARARTEQLLNQWKEHFPEIRDADTGSPELSALSTGQRRLLQAVRLVAARKPVWLLDEPFTGLDLSTARRLAALLRQEAADKAVLILTATPCLLEEIGWGDVPARTLAHLPLLKERPELA
jgi:ABC-type bacteriocin/lantibiotic exporter with double-glycine peptidase domain